MEVSNDMVFKDYNDWRADMLANKVARQSAVDQKASTASKTGMQSADIYRGVDADLEDYMRSKQRGVQIWDIYKGSVLSSWEGLDPLRIENYCASGDDRGLATYISEWTGQPMDEVEEILADLRATANQ